MEASNIKMIQGYCTNAVGPIRAFGGNDMKNMLRALLICSVAGLLLTGVSIQSVWAEPAQASSDRVTAELLRSGLGFPPYRMEVLVKSVYGRAQVGTKDLLGDCLREDLMALGTVKLVKGVESEIPPPVLRIRVFFTETPKVEEGECFDLTLVVVVGKIRKEDPRYEAVLDAYALAGVKERDLEGLCNKIASRFDLKILSVLRSQHQSTK